MSLFQDYLELTEALVTFSGKAYPKYGHFVILAGGAGSGKGFVIDKLLGIEAKVLDVDHTKSLALKSEHIGKKIESIVGKPVSQINLKTPEDVRSLHVALSDILGITKKKEDVLFRSISSKSKETLPNLMFDTTLKDFKKLGNLIELATVLGYSSNNIHLVWVVNDIEVAKVQNQNRSRTVPEDILVQTHEGASLTMKKVYEMSGSLHGLNGDIWFVFNKSGVDSTISKSNTGKMVVDSAKYFKLKSHGKTSFNRLPEELLNKIKSYTPNGGQWS